MNEEANDFSGGLEHSLKFKRDQYLKYIADQACQTRSYVRVRTAKKVLNHRQIPCRVKSSFNNPSEDVHILSRKPVPLGKYHKAYDLDSETCYGVKSLELAKMTVIVISDKGISEPVFRPSAGPAIKAQVYQRGCLLIADIH
ncbi:hypothetical protein ILUMI_13008 [Ignelater luminosus]|uniref:Uncharacterized protein n=1 Tax=Ignelater luminosus TaxID=2038154 RepID=A0A8K0CT45_IGNLU|nr:hypothetical protein ILUMI_13008 [Ignelater luminosus]